MNSTSVEKTALWLIELKKLLSCLLFLRELTSFHPVLKSCIFLVLLNLGSLERSKRCLFFSTDKRLGIPFKKAYAMFQPMILCIDRSCSFQTVPVVFGEISPDSRDRVLHMVPNKRPIHATRKVASWHWLIKPIVLRLPKLFFSKQTSNTGGDNSNKRCFGTKPKFFRESGH